MKANDVVDRKEQEKRRGANNQCPFVSNPLEECYCYDMNSQKILKAVMYCNGPFDTCEVYRKTIKAKEHKVF